MFVAASRCRDCLCGGACWTRTSGTAQAALRISNPLHYHSANAPWFSTTHHMASLRHASPHLSVHGRAAPLHTSVDWQAGSSIAPPLLSGDSIVASVGFSRRDSFRHCTKPLRLLSSGNASRTFAGNPSGGSVPGRSPFAVRHERRNQTVQVIWYLGPFDGTSCMAREEWKAEVKPTRRQGY